MKRYFLLGIATFGLIASAPTDSKADDGFRIYINPGYQQHRSFYYGDDRYGYYRHADEYRWHRWHRYHHRHHYNRDYNRGHDRD